jgi:hypothetical protein
MIKIEISKELRYSYGNGGVNPVWAWCIEQFGQPFSLGHKFGRWNTDTYTGFLFRDEKDAALFALRWAE